MKFLAACGLICSECPAFIATKKNDTHLREKTALEWSETHQAQIKAEDIRCLGCSNEEVLFSYCYECNIRACCHEKGLSNCAKCFDYPCNHVEEFFQFVPETQETLDNLII